MLLLLLSTLLISSTSALAAPSLARPRTHFPRASCYHTRGIVRCAQAGDGEPSQHAPEVDAAIVLAADKQLASSEWELEQTSRAILLLAGALLVGAASLHAAPAAAAGAGAAQVAQAAASTPSASTIFEKAAKRALGGGISGALAGVVQVILLMWLRTTMNYQYKNGGGTRDALDALYAEGGVRRFYRGVGFALVQTPLTRFGDTAANAGVLALLATSDLPIGLRTAAASATASVWRIGLTPLDTMKTTLQVSGPDGYEQVKAKVADEGFPVLFQGALANAFASFVGVSEFGPLAMSAPLVHAATDPVHAPFPVDAAAQHHTAAAPVHATQQSSIRRPPLPSP